LLHHYPNQFFGCVSADGNAGINEETQKERHVLTNSIEYLIIETDYFLPSQFHMKRDILKRKLN